MRASTFSTLCWEEVSKKFITVVPFKRTTVIDHLQFTHPMCFGDRKVTMFSRNFYGILTQFLCSSSTAYYALEAVRAYVKLA